MTDSEEDTLAHEVVEEKERGHPNDAKELTRDRMIGLLIGVFAVLLALTEILGQSAQTKAVQSNIEAANTWAFFQAKAERETTYSVAMDAIEALQQSATDAQKSDLGKMLAKWRVASAKLHDDPEKNTGTIQLYQGAKTAEHERDVAEKKHRRYELASAALHIGIVLMSASIITGLQSLVTAAFGCGALAAMLVLIGLLT